MRYLLDANTVIGLLNDAAFEPGAASSAGETCRYRFPQSWRTSFSMVRSRAGEPNGM
jgi:hypothetical protein